MDDFNDCKYIRAQSAPNFHNTVWMLNAMNIRCVDIIFRSIQFAKRVQCACASHVKSPAKRKKKRRIFHILIFVTVGLSAGLCLSLHFAKDCVYASCFPHFRWKPFFFLFLFYLWVFSYFSFLDLDFVSFFSSFLR